MPEIQIRPAIATDLSALMAIDHSCQTDYVWQMDVQHEDGQIGAIFREIRLPRSVSVLYPRPVSSLSESWSRRSGMLVAVIGGQTVGYVRANDAILPRTAWLMDVVIAPRFRRQGIASALVLAAQSWAVQRKDRRALLEMLSKNNPAIRLAQKLGYEFCGYNDQYYETQDIALFFGRSIR
ncbi:MAG: GNAT family N-acetyltransferase [Anaerolineales bacterium]|jgi:ribosomal protein S18 acetylase RimI-like enzyme|nr:GNAT family N-acetyltransferase [Chloroflexota bacterium]MBE3117543.1 GNAT family N-acetyltransferase [Candidatus Atribacteria bacterium]MDP2995628.1 GNAT family N-acetyltransferase [Anaerolineales bacterium]